jgi:polysaccharide pyruvyl transferase WcaK-like protein
MNRPDAKIDYIGWTGHGNLGDEACLSAIRALLGRRGPVQVRPTMDPTGPAVVLGGGTLLFGTGFLEPAEAALRRGAKLFVFGTGVDLSLPLDRWGERKPRWGRALRAARFVGVRGPRSLDAVKRLGARSVRVIGDPALSLAGLHDRPHRQRKKLVLLNAGSDFPLPGGAARLMDRLGSLVEHVRAEGYRVEYLALRPGDAEKAKQLLDRCRLRVVPPRMPAVLEAIHRSRFVVGTRLHAGVFAAACGVPPLMLAYQPKHHDFAASIGWERHVWDAHHVEAGELLAALRRLEHCYSDAVVHLRRAVAVCRDLQQAAADVVLRDAPRPTRKTTP